MTATTTTASPFVTVLGSFNPSGNHAALMVKLTTEMMAEISALHTTVHSGQVPITELPQAQLRLIRDAYRQTTALIEEGRDQILQTQNLIDSLLDQKNENK